MRGEQVSFLDKIGGLLGGGLGEKIAGIIGNRIENKQQGDLLRLEIEKAIGERAHEVEMAVIAQATTIASEQSKTNQIEAASDSLFKSGWRPAIGWICGAALFYQMILRPLLAYALQTILAMPPPPLELDTLLTLLFGILGLGAYRTYEKTR